MTITIQNPHVLILSVLLDVGLVICMVGLAVAAVLEIKKAIRGQQK